MNPYEAGNLEPHQPRGELQVGQRRLFWLFMVIIGGLTLAQIVFFVLGLLVVSWLLNA